jgi:hypothetical protein
MGYSAQCCAGGAYDTQRMEVGEGMKITIRLAGPAQRALAKQKIYAAQDGQIVTIADPTRTDLQNNKLHPMLRDISRQCTLPSGARATLDGWKYAFLKGLGHEIELAEDLDGNMFPIGMSSKNLSVREFAELIEFIYSWATPRGVIWSEPNPYERKE